MKPRILSTARLSFPLATALAALLAANSASATNLYWDTNGTGAAGTGAVVGTWGTDAFWTTDSTGLNVGSPVLTAATTNADDLFFSAGTNGGNGTVTVLAGSTQNAHSITFEEGAITLAPGAGAAINLGSATAGSGLSFNNVIGYNMNTPIILNSAATNIAFKVLGNQTVTYGATGTIAGSSSGLQTITIGGLGSSGGGSTFNGIISNGGGGGTVGVTVNANSNNILAAANTYTGATNIVYGNLRIDNAATFSNTSAINLSPYGRLEVNAANQSLAKLSTGVVAGSFLRYTQAQTTGTTGPGTILGTVELNNASVNPNYTLDFGAGSTLTNLITTNYTSALSLSGNASINASPANAAHTATYSTGGITASTAGAKTLTLVGTNTAANTISGAIGNGSGTIDILKSGAGNWILSGTNTYTGNTRVDAGTLQFTNQVSLYNNGAAAAWSNTNINVAGGATMAFNVAGAGQFAVSDINTILGLSNSASNGFNSGSFLGIDTTGGNFLYDNVIADPNGGANVLGLTKLGTNSLILDQANTYTGRTLISGGTLELGNGGDTGSLSPGSTIINNGTLKINRDNTEEVKQGTHFSAAPITGTGSLTIAGGCTTTLNVANTFSGTTTVSGAGTTLILTNDLALQNSALVTTGGGTVTFPDVTPVLGGLSGATGNVSDIISAFNTTTTLSLNGIGGPFTYGGVIGDGAGGLTLTKNGAGTQILSGVNTYTGATIINAGTLTLNRKTGSLNGSTGTALTFGGTGTFNMDNVGATGALTQNLGALTFSAGDGTVKTTRTAAQNEVITFASLAARTAGATANFVHGGGTNSASNGFTLTSTTNAPLSSTGSNNQGLFFGGTEYARYDATNNFFRATIYGTDTNALATVPTGLTIGTVDAAKDVKITGAITAQTTAAVNTLNLGANAFTITAANTLSVNGLISTGTQNFGAVANQGSIQSTADGGEIVVNTTANTLTLNSVIQNFSGGSLASALTKSGAGALTLSGTNTYTGTTIVNSGTLSVGSLTALPVSANVTVRNGGTFSYGIAGTHRAYNVALNGGNLSTAFENSTMPGTYTLGTGTTSTLSFGGRNNDISANITGAGNLNSTAAGNRYFLSGTNDYTGTTLLSGVTGAVVFVKPSALYNSVQASWTPANITVNSGAILGIRGGDGLTTGFDSTQINTLLGNLSTVNNNGLLAGSLVNIDTSTTPFNYTGVISDSTGPGGGSVGVYLTPGQTLTLSGANTYTGRTVFRGYFAGNVTSVSVSSFNSVFTNPSLGTVHSASSSLGAPTTVANGTINFGDDGAQVESNLIYTGTGETTDRVINIAGNASTPNNLYQSGSGLLKFTSPFTKLSGSASPLTLRGVGNGEVAGLPNLGSLTKTDAGTWTIAGNNTTLGLTTVSGGALVLAHANALNGGIGSTGGVGGLTFNGGVLGLGTDNNTFSRPLAAAGTAGAVNFTNAGGWAAYGADRTVNLGGASASITWATANTGLNGKTLILGNVTSTHTLDFQNPLDLGNATRTVQVDNGSAAIDGKLSGILSGAGGGLTKTGLGTLVLSNTNSYTGATAVQAGTVLVGTNAPSASNGALGNASSEVNLGVAGGNNNAGILIGGAFDFGRIIRLLTNNTTDTGTRVLTLGGSTADNSTFSGNIILGTTSQAGRGVTLTAANGGQVTFSGVIQNPATMDVTTYTVAKEGLGTVVLGNANTYTGATAVNAGTLSVTGSLGATAVSVNAGTLSGNGNFGGDVTIASGATHSLAVAATSLAQDTSAITGTLAMADSILNLTAASTPAAGEYVLATATSITGTPTTINYNGITGTVSVDTASNPDRLLLTVTGGSAYDSWATLKGLTVSNKAMNLDPDNDGRNNLAEFAFDGDPLSGANDGKIVGKVATVGGNQVMTLTLPVRAVASFSPSSGDQLSALIDGIYYRIEGDVSLSTFADTITEVTSGEEVAIQTGLPALTATGAPGWTYRTFRHSGTVPATPKAFLRAKVSETP